MGFDSDYFSRERILRISLDQVIGIPLVLLLFSPLALLYGDFNDLKAGLYWIVGLFIVLLLIWSLATDSEQDYRQHREKHEEREQLEQGEGL